MDANKYYCRSTSQSATPPTTSSSSSTATNACSGSNEYNNGCGSNHLTTGYDCKEHYIKNANSKNMISNRNTHATATTTAIATGNGIITNDVVNSNVNSNENYNNNASNYINVMQVPVGSLQYQRRKLAPHEFQSRLYYNTADYRCRDEYHSSGDATTSSPSPTVQLQHQHQHQSHHHQQTAQHPQHAPSTTQQQQQHHHHQSNHHHSQAQPQYNQLHQHQTPRQSICSPNGQANTIDDTQNCARYVAQSGRIVAATQTQTSTNNTCHSEQLNDNSLGNITMTGPPMMYAVHRVVTTAQIQTAAGNTFASSSSVSSVVSALRNENECAAAMTGTTAGLNAKCLSGNNAGSTAGYLSDSCNTMSNNGNSLRTSAGICTTATYMAQQQKSNSSSDIQNNSIARTSNNSYATTNTLSNTNLNNSSKSSTALPRALQNVIPTCVYLMSRVAVHMEIEGTAQCPTQVMLAAALGCEELGIANKLLAQSIFGLWMTSTLLEIQLKPHHRPYAIRVAWPNLLEKYSDGNPIEKKFDEPMIMLKRNVFFSKRDEEKIKDHRILELLYEEAKHNVLSGKYIMEPVHSLMLGGIQARIELGPYNSHTHTVGFFRENQSRFLPLHVAKSTSWSWLPVSRKNSAEVKLLEQFKRVPQTATTRKLMRKYLEFCWALPFYGAAFFHGQVEQPVRGLISLVNHKDVEVNIAINERGVFVIDPFERTLLLGLRYEDLSWDFAKPSSCDDAECQTCIFIQFDAIENGIQLSKLMQIFSKQAALIDALISHFAEQMRKRKQESNVSEQFHDEPNPIQNNGNGVLCNKLSRLTLATFDEEGRCIGQMGSLSISY